MNEREKKMSENEKEAHVVNPPEETMEAKLTDNQILDALNNPVIYNMKPDFFRLGNELLTEVKEMLEYTSLARKVFVPRLLKPGEVCRYDKEKDSVAYVVSEDQKRISKVEKGIHVYPPELEVIAYPTTKKYTYRDIATAKKEIKKMQEKAFHSIINQEDSAAIKLLLEAGKENQKIKSNPYDILTSLITEFNPKRLICDKILMNRKDVKFLEENKEKFKGALDLFSKPIDHFAKKELRRAGYIGKYMSTMLLTTSEGIKEDIIPEGNLIAIASPEYLGGMPIRVEFFSEPINELLDGHPRFGWFWYELISMLITNTNAVVLGEINY